MSKSELVLVSSLVLTIILIKLSPLLCALIGELTNSEINS